MKLKTTFFNGTVLKKDITRFAPVWGLYTVFMLMVLFLIREGEGSAARFANNASGIMQTMGIVNFCYAGLCAVLLFGDLFTARMCNALHALPMRREGWFLTHCAAGFLFCLVPNTLGAVLAALLLEQYFYLAFLWLGLMVLQFLFFFGAGVFGVMCAGNRLGAAAVYGIFNFLSVLAAWLIMTFYEPFLYGIELDLEQYAVYSPVVGFSNSQYVETTYDKLEGTLFEGFLPEDWRYLFIAAVVGLGLLVLAVLIYRRRSLESAGDFISLQPVGPVFLIIYTLCVGAVMYYAADLVEESARYVFLVIGFVIGFFTGRMLLERKVNVFQGRNFLAFGALMAAFAVSVGLTWLDPVGVTRYVPRVQDVKQVQISPYASSYYWTNSKCVLTEQADIATVIGIHEDMLEKRSMDGDVVLRVGYELQSGAVVERKYYLDANSDAVQTLKGYYSAWEYVFGTDDLDALLENAYLLEFYSHRYGVPHVAVAIDENMMGAEDLDEKYGIEDYAAYLVKDLVGDEGMVKGLNVELVRGLVEAIKADCDAGNMAQLWEYHQGQDSSGWLNIQYFVPQEGEDQYTYDQVRGLDITIYDDCTNTIEYLKSITAQ